MSPLEAYRAGVAERQRLAKLVDRARDRLTEMERAVATAEADELLAVDEHAKVLAREIEGTASEKELAAAAKAVTDAGAAAKKAEAAIAPVEAVLAKAKADLAAHKNRMDAIQGQLASAVDAVLVPRCLAAWEAAYQAHAHRLALVKAIGIELTGSSAILGDQRVEVAARHGLASDGALRSYTMAPRALDEIATLLGEVPREP